MLPYVVVDASVAGAWLFPEPFSLNAQPVLAAVAAQRVIAIAPDRFGEELLRVCQKKTFPPPAGASIQIGDAWSRWEAELWTLDAVLRALLQPHMRRYSIFAQFPFRIER